MGDIFYAVLLRAFVYGLIAGVVIAAFITLLFWLFA